MTCGVHETTLRAVGGQPTTGGVLLGIGSAPGCVEEAAWFLSEEPGVRVCAINDAISAWPGDLEFAASGHAQFLSETAGHGRERSWLAERSARCGSVPQWVVSTQEAEGVNLIIENQFPLASSAMLMVLLGLHLGCERIVLAGVALSRPGYRESFLHLWRGAARDGLLDRVRCLTPGPVQDLVGDVKR